RLLLAARTALAAERRPGNEADAVGFAVIEHRIAAARAGIVAVLHRGDGEVPLRRLDLFDADFAEASVADQAIGDEALDGVELLVGRDAGIDAVQLPQVDALELEAAHAEMDLLLQIFGPADLMPDIR